MDLDDEELEATRKLHNRKEEIEVGEYVRTKNKGIKKIDHLNINPNATINKYRYFLYIDEDGDRCYGTLKTTDIVNHSKDIADLIGYGDFINGKMCIDIEHYIRDDGTKGINFVCIGGSVLKENIKNVVTKEQFNQVKYEV